MRSLLASLAILAIVANGFPTAAKHHHCRPHQGLDITISGNWSVCISGNKSEVDNNNIGWDSSNSSSSGDANESFGNNIDSGNFDDDSSSSSNSVNIFNDDDSFSHINTISSSSYITSTSSSWTTATGPWWSSYSVL